MIGFESARALLSGKDVSGELWNLRERYQYLARNLSGPCSHDELPDLEQLLFDLEVRKQQEKREPVREALESLESLLHQKRATILPDYGGGRSLKRPYQKLYDTLLGKEHFTYKDRFVAMERELLRQSSIGSYAELDDLKRTIYRLEKNRYICRKAEEEGGFAKRREQMLEKLKSRLNEEEERLKRKTHEFPEKGLPVYTLPERKWGRPLFTAAAMVAGGLALILSTYLPTRSSVKKVPTSILASRSTPVPEAALLVERPLTPSISHTGDPQKRLRSTISYPPSHFIEKLYERRTLRSGKVSIADPEGYHLLVDGRSYTAYLVHRRKIIDNFPVSTGVGGFSNKSRSYGTPTGLHQVESVFGLNGEKDLSYKRRVPERKKDGSLIFAHDAPHLKLSERRITSRILWLEGIDPGVNDLSHARYIYIHGTNGEYALGGPASEGCIACADDVIIPLVDKKELKKGSRVYVIKP